MPSEPGPSLEPQERAGGNSFVPLGRGGGGMLMLCNYVIVLGHGG